MANEFYDAIGGRFFDTLAPDGAEMPFAVYMVISNTDVDTFTEAMQEIYIQISLFSNASSSSEIKDLDRYLTALLKDTVFTVTGWTVITTQRIQGNGPYIISAEESEGVGRHWQMDVDFIVYVSKV